MRAAFDLTVGCEDMEDVIEEYVCHESVEEEKLLHVRQRFVKIPCPCQPYIELFPDYIRVLHRRLQ